MQRCRDVSADSGVEPDPSKGSTRTLGGAGIIVENAAGRGRGVRAVTLDAQAVPDGEIPLMDDGRAHAVRVELR